MKSLFPVRLSAFAISSVVLGMTSCIAWGHSLPKVENAPSVNHHLTSAQKNALAGYIQDRYRRVKATIEKDRAKAHQLMSADAWRVYKNRFHPDTALPEFKRCTKCSEFGIRITRIVNRGCSIIRLELHQPGELTCRAIFVFQTVAVAPATAPARKMATRLSWHPSDVVKVPPYEDVKQTMRDAGSDIVITGDHPLVRRHSVESCLGTAAAGRPCQGKGGPSTEWHLL